MSDQYTIGSGQNELKVLSSTRHVVQSSQFVTIDDTAIDRVAVDLAERNQIAPDWSPQLHWRGDQEQTANYVLVLDALNFCFWGEPRWKITYAGETYDGYWALASALKRAIENDVPVYSADYLATLTEDDLAGILAGENEIPLLSQRLKNLHEVGSVLRDRYDGRFSELIRRNQGSAVNLVRQVITLFPSFRDESIYAGQVVRFYKRAQILVSDLYGTFRGVGLGAFYDMPQLTAFADYKVPQVLQSLGILHYRPALEAMLAEKREIPAGSAYEIEIRAATIWAVELLRRALEERGRSIPAYQIDWMLWNLGQELAATTLPYHRTRTIYY